MITDRTLSLRLCFGSPESSRYRLDLSTSLDFDTQSTTPQFFVACVRTCDAQHLSCSSSLAVTL
jgi:hypothetical protein